MTLHYAPTTPEEEELALALALSASLASGKAGGPNAMRDGSHSFTSSQSSRSNFSPPSPSGSHSPAAPATSTAHHPASTAQRPAQAAPAPQPASATARPPGLPPGLGSPPHIFPTHLPLPTPRLPSTTASRPAPQHQRSASALPLTSALPTSSQQPPAQPNRGSSNTSPMRGRFTWGGSGPSSPKGQAAAGGTIPPAGPHPRPSAVSAPGGSMPGSQPPRPSGPHATPPGPAPPLPPLVGRSKSATGPNGMLGAAGSGGGGARVALGGSGSCFGSSGGGKGAGGGSCGGSGRSTAGGAAGCGSTPPARAAAAPPAPPLELHSDPNACAGCGRGFGLFSSDCITGMGRKWHTGCFRCGFCSEPISTGRGSFSYNMHPGDPRPYHPDCYRHAHHPVCTVCATYISPGPDGRITYRENGFWRQRYCTAHAEDGLTRCCACSRMQQMGEEWAPLPDGRPLCLQCLSSTVLDTREAQPLYEEVLRFYAQEMRLPHPYKPPLLLVDGPTLNEHAAAEGRRDSEAGPVFHVRGLCVAQVYSHIPAILRGLGGGLRSVATALSPADSPGGVCSPLAAQPPPGPQRAHCHVSVLLLLYGLPRLLSGSIMAHELMHAWLRMAGLVGLPLRTEEGLCQLMACLWLDRQHELLHADPDEQRLASFFAYQIRTDTSEVYGDGFREAMEAFQAHGLTYMIQNLKMYGSFTPP